jgi:hypothetical protein
MNIVWNTSKLALGNCNPDSPFHPLQDNGKIYRNSVKEGRPTKIDADHQK